MGANTDSLAAMDLFTFKVFWKGTTLGFVKEVDPTGLKPISKEKKVGNFGEAVIDRIRMGVTGSIKTTLHQVKAAVIKDLCAWWTSGPVPLTPSALHFSEYDNAGALRLHPFGIADETVTDDLTYVKAFPVFTPPKAGGDWREIEVEWNIYPDQTQLASGLWITHYHGALPE